MKGSVMELRRLWTLWEEKNLASYSQLQVIHKREIYLVPTLEY